MVRIRYSGFSYDMTEAEVGVAAHMSDSEIKQRLAQHFDLSLGSFQALVVDRGPHGDLIIRPSRSERLIQVLDGPR